MQQTCSPIRTTRDSCRECLMRIHKGKGVCILRRLSQFLQLYISRQLKWHPTGASIEVIPQCKWDIASLSSSPHGYNISVLSGAAWAQAYLNRWDRGTCLLTSLRAWPLKKSCFVEEISGIFQGWIQGQWQRDPYNGSL